MKKVILYLGSLVLAIRKYVSILIKVLLVCVCVCLSNFCSKFKGFVSYISVVISMMLLLFQITFILVKWLLLFQIIFSQKMFSDQVCKHKAACRTYHKVANFHLLQKTICCYTCYVRQKRCPQGLDFQGA